MELKFSRRTAVRFLLIPTGYVKCVHKITVPINSVSNTDQFNYKKLQVHYRDSHIACCVLHTQDFSLGLLTYEADAICNYILFSNHVFV
jgi:hypothetical protein